LRLCDRLGRQREDRRQRDGWHFRLGYVVFTLLAFRLVWGLVGGHWSRSRFIYAPSTVLRYLRGASRSGEHLDVGHSPSARSRSSRCSASSRCRSAPASSPTTRSPPPVR
jgi:hypothetical protein